VGPRSARLRYLSQITAATDRRQGVAPTVVRVVEYALARIGAATGSRAVPAADHDPGLRGGPAAELAALYHQRWEFEMCQPQCTHIRELAA
jgi:hypothetical protein